MINMDMAQEGRLYTWHKRFIVVKNNVLTQTDKAEESDIMCIVYDNLIALYSEKDEAYIRAINSDGTFSITKAISFFPMERVLENDEVWIRIQSDNHFLSARDNREGYAINFSKNCKKWEAFKFLHLRERNIADEIRKKLLVGDNAQRDEVAELKKKLDEMASDVDLLMHFYRKTAPPALFAPELTKWYSRYRHADKNFNIKNPRTFNEKLQWLKLFGDQVLMTRLSDKIRVRDYIEEKGLGEILIPLYGTYDYPEQIDYSVLPDSFVIKCNHGSGMNIIVKSKSQIDIPAINKKLRTWLGMNWAFSNYELQYRNIEPRILIEQNISINGSPPPDYKIFCFHGKPQVIAVTPNRGKGTTRSAVFNVQWERLATNWHFPSYEKPVAKPVNLERLLEVASILSADVPHVRVDLYHQDDGKIYFGEMTFTSLSGLNDWGDQSMDVILGDLLHVGS